ncbi:MAG: D-alanyl-D-alanine carboxypeptidase [Gammaproteobacteria bacterium]|nr:D-alanyl-D-alanine carboxypeptidase [Gammaproteobacteria bacterium]
MALVLVVVPTTSYATFIVPQPPTLEAKSYVLMDAQSKKVLVEFNSREKLPPASLTKIMTSYVAAAEVDSGRLKVEEMVPISVTAWETPGSRMFIREGTTVSVSDLLRGIIIQSGNDASVAIAEYISGSEDEFAKLMNEYGEHLGLEDTIFKNSTGLPDVDHLSTAYDNALLARALILDYPEHYAMYAERDFTYNDIRQPNRNRLLALDETVDGVKTGYTEDAGYCLVASSMREGMRLISVVLGTDSNEVRIRETRKLFNYGFRNFEFRNLVGPETTFEVDVANGKEKTVEARLRTAVKHLVLRGDSSTKMTVQPVKDLKAPVDAGDVVGVLQVTVEGEEIATESLYAQADVEQIGFFQGIMQAIADFFSSKPKPEEPSATEEEEEES